MQKPAVNVMVKAARAGGNMLLRHMHRLDAINVIEKDRFDYASEVDSLAEVEIIKELKRANPDYAILAEEGGKQKGIRDGGRFTWVIDPLDGTSNYLHGFPHWCVSIALVENGEPIHIIAAGASARRRGLAVGAYVAAFYLGSALSLWATGALLATGFPPRERARIGAQLECVRELLRDAEDVRRTGSAALDLAYVACGRTDGYFEAGLQPWDIAAGVLLVREAGGRVCDYRGAAPGRMDVAPTRGHQIVAGGIKLVEPLQKTIVSSGYATAFA